MYLEITTESPERRNTRKSNIRMPIVGGFFNVYFFGFVFVCSFDLETGSHYVIETGLEITLEQRRALLIKGTTCKQS